MVSYATNCMFVQSDSLIAAGSVALADSTSANVASYSLTNSTWSSVGQGSDLPGPVTALEINNGNASSVFAAGRLVWFLYMMYHDLF